MGDPSHVKPLVKRAGWVIIDQNGSITVEDFDINYDHEKCDGCRSVAVVGATWALKKLSEALMRDANGQKSGIGLG